MAKSIIQNEKECFICGTTLNLHEHHCLYGTANRNQSEKYGLKVWLCQPHHTGKFGVHSNRVPDLQIKRIAQMTFERKIGTREDFMKEFGKSYL